MTPRRFSLKLRRMKRYRHRAFMFSWVLIAVASCLIGAQSSGTIEYLQRSDLSGARGGNLIVAVNSDPPTFNRLLTPLLAHAMLADRLSADLVHINRITLDLEPALARQWTLEKDGRTYTLFLRRGLRFSDGSPFTADDVLFTLQVVQDPKSGSTFRDLLEIDGVFPKVSKVDSYTVQIAFPRPVGVGLRTLDSLSILPKQRLQKLHEEGKLASAWGPSTAPSEIVGLGPFRLKEHQPGVKVVFERNPYYWKKDRQGLTLPYLDTLTFLIIPDRNSEALRLQAGDIHLVNFLDAQNFAALKRREREADYKVRDLGAGLEMDYLWFNLNPGKNSAGKPFVDPEKRSIFAQSAFRRAVSHALDRPKMAQSLLLGLGIPQYGPISPGNTVWYHKGLSRTEFDIDRAKEMLASIGLKDTDGDGVLEFGAKRPLEITLLTARGNLRRERMVQVVRNNLAHVGIRVGTQVLDPRDLIQRFRGTYEYEAVLFGFTPTDVTPDVLADLWLTRGSNHFWYPNQASPATPWEKEMDSQILRLLRTLDAAERKRIFDQVQQIWVTEMPAIPMIVPNILVAWKSAVGNLRPSILSPQLLWNAEELVFHAR